MRELRAWTPDGEISAIGFFPLDALPEPMSPNALLRIRDVAAGASGVMRALVAPGVVR